MLKQDINRESRSPPELGEYERATTGSLRS